MPPQTPSASDHALNSTTIAYISDQHYPVAKADSEQVINTVAALAGAGLDIRLVIPGDWRNRNLTPAARKQRLVDFYHVHNGFRVEELFHLPLSRLRAEKYSHGVLAPFRAKRARVDLVYTRNPLPACVAVLLGLRVVFETYRVYSRRNWLVAQCLARLSRSPKLLGIITHSPPSKASLSRLGVRPDKITVIHNGFNPRVFHRSLTRAQARKELGWSETGKYACYAGRLARDKGIPSLLTLARSNPDVTFVFIGKNDRNGENWIEAWARQKNLANVRCLSWMHQEALAPYLFASDVLLIPPTATPLMKYRKTVLPMKLFQYLAVGRPILAPRLPDIQSVLNDRNAILVEADNPEAAHQALRRVFSEPEWAAALARQARADSQAYTWENRARRIISFLEERLP